jgi:predicted metal-dependent hydrolase
MLYKEDFKMSIFSKTKLNVKSNNFSKTNTKDNVKNNSKYGKCNQTDNFLLGKDETLQPKFTRIFGISYSIDIYYLKIKSPELNLEKNKIVIYLPMQYRHFNNQKLLDAILLKMYSTIAENEIGNIMEKARHEFGFAPEDYKIVKTSNALATCSKEDMFITVNPYIVKFDKKAIEYIIYHEFCHLQYKTHSKKFYELLKKHIPNYESICRQLNGFTY